MEVRTTKMTRRSENDRSEGEVLVNIRTYYLICQGKIIRIENEIDFLISDL